MLIEFSITYLGAHYAFEVSEEICIIRCRFPYRQTYEEVNSLPHAVCCQALRELAKQIPYRVLE